MKDRLSILAEIRERPKKLINPCNEIYGACGHKIRLHRYIRNALIVLMAELIQKGSMVGNLNHPHVKIVLLLIHAVQYLLKKILTMYL